MEVDQKNGNRELQANTVRTAYTNFPEKTIHR